MTSLLVDVAPTDTPSYVVVAGVLLVAATLSCYLPARQALRVPVVAALRGE